MAKILGRCLVLILTISICKAAVFQPISGSHLSAALEFFTPVDGIFSSLEETYEALRTFEILGIEKSTDISTATCTDVSKKLKSSSSSNSKDLFYALRVNGALNCKVGDEVYEGITSILLANVNNASSLLDYYHYIGSLVLVKDQSFKADLHLDNANEVIRSIKALGQSDGRWCYSANNPESSTFAAGIALETLAGIISLASSEIDQSMIGTVTNDAVKLFDSIEKYDDGIYFFDEKLADASQYQGPLSTSSSVVRGLTKFAAVTSGRYNIPGEKILGLAKFFLGYGTSGNAKDLFNQVDSLACLESNRISVPLILSLPSTVLSLTKKDKLKVKVNTVLGYDAPSLSVKLIKAYSTDSKDASVIESQELKFDKEDSVYYLDTLPKTVDVGSYVFAFEIVLHDSESTKAYAIGGQTKIPVYITGIIKIDNAEIAKIDRDRGSIEAQQKLNLAEEDRVSLAANHLQKLRLSFQLTTPLGRAFKPHQAFLKLKHESKVEHIYVIESSSGKFQIILDFLGLVERLYYLSGKYDIELTVGDTVMENSFLKHVGDVELDLPEAPEKATRPPRLAVEPCVKYCPKNEISHIFRVPEKLPPRELSLVFLGLNFLPLVGFLVGLSLLGVNLNNFPTTAVPAIFAVLFHGGIAAVLGLYMFFWFKLDLFTTLKWVGFLGVFLIFVGHRILSHLSSTSAKLKST